MLPKGILQGEMPQHNTATGEDAAWGDINMADIMGGDNALYIGDIAGGDVDGVRHCRREDMLHCSMATSQGEISMADIREGDNML